ncbi:MAG: ATP-binding protein [Nannocystaceae bacterium]|nr:response regulator [bacterium]
MQSPTRAWTVVRALMGVVVALIASVAVVTALEGNPVSALVLVAGALMLLPPLVFGPRIGSLYPVGNSVAAVMVLMLVGLAWLRGGVAMTITAWLAMVPMVVSMFGRRGPALIWSGVVLLSVAVLGVAEASSWAPAPSQPPLLVRWISASALVAVSLWLALRARSLETERQRVLSERAVAGQKLESLGRLAGGIAHDFNNVLAVVLARADDALQTTEPGAREYADLHAIRTAAKRGASLASELVAFSRRGPATYDVMKPYDVIAGAEQVLGRLVRENVQVSIEAEDAVPPIEGDRDHLLQVLLNLALNAQDAMPQGGHLRLKLTSATVVEPAAGATGIIPPGQYAVLSVHDEGTGMSAEVQARVFEPFFTTKERGQGSGIGLATVNAIITQHGGYVRLASTLGVGSTFDVYLPLTSRSDELRDTTDDVDGAQTRESCRLLLVEDDALVRRALEVTLSRAGHKVVPAANGAEALARWEETSEPFDVVLTDVLMPGMTGPDLIRQLRADAPALNVVYMSGHVEDAMRDVDLEQERSVFVRKPASRAALLRALEDAVREGGPAQPAQ